VYVHACVCVVYACVETKPYLFDGCTYCARGYVVDVLKCFKCPYIRGQFLVNI
jgi:hypothetical protein